MGFMGGKPRAGFKTSTLLEKSKVSYIVVSHAPLAISSENAEKA